MKHGFLKVAAITPKTKTGNIDFNVKQINQKIVEAHTLAVQIAAFPELCVSGKEIGDMCFHPAFLSECESGLKKITDTTRQRDITCFVGLPVKIEQKIYNAVACLSRGLILGITIKNDLTMQEKRFFSPLEEEFEEIEIAGFVCPVSNNLLYTCQNLSLGVCQSPIPDFRHTRANLILNVNSKVETVENYSSDFLRNCSREYCLGIMDVGGGIFESTAVNMYLPTKALYECGETLFYSQSFLKEMLISDIDLDRIDYIRAKNNAAKTSGKVLPISLKHKRDYEVLDRKFDKFPFQLRSAKEHEKMLKILATAIYNRVKHVKAESIVIGVSGGLDSTATLLVADKFCDMFEFDRENVLCLTLPGFASSEATFKNAVTLIKLFGFTHKNVPISDAVKNHLMDLEHDMTEDVTYENAQARERTQILMDFANMTNGIMLGTSDMSEEALGFSTFGGDQISMLNVLSGVCKTTLTALVLYYIENIANIDEKQALHTVLATPISPELKAGQETEKQLGSYQLHDFILYHFLANGYSPEKILLLLEKTFEEIPIAQLVKTLEVFFQRFFKSQFKRNATSDGVKIFDVSLSSSNFALNSDFNGDILKK